MWYGNSSSQECKALQRVVRLAERISGSALPSLQDIYIKRCRSRAVKITKDSNHPGNCLFTLLPSGKRFRSLMAKTERLRRSFFPRPSGSWIQTELNSALNIMMTSLTNHSQSVIYSHSLSSTSYWQCNLHTILSFAHNTFCILISYHILYLFFCDCCSCHHVQPVCTFPLPYSHAYLNI